MAADEARPAGDQNRAHRRVLTFAERLTPEIAVSATLATTCRLYGSEIPPISGSRNGSQVHRRPVPRTFIRHLPTNRWSGSMGSRTPRRRRLYNQLRRFEWPLCSYRSGTQQLSPQQTESQLQATLRDSLEQQVSHKQTSQHGQLAAAVAVTFPTKAPAPKRPTKVSAETRLRIRRRVSDSLSELLDTEIDRGAPWRQARSHSLDREGDDDPWIRT